jgi:ribosomal protein L37AE/L43A
MRRLDQASNVRRAESSSIRDFRAYGSRPCVVCGQETCDRRSVSAWKVPCCSIHGESTVISPELTLSGVTFKNET